MTSSDERQPKSRRGLFWLVAFIVVLFAIYSGGWFYLADRVRSEADKAVATLNKQRHRGRLRQPPVSGYPLELHRLLRQPCL